MGPPVIPNTRASRSLPARRERCPNERGLARSALVLGLFCGLAVACDGQAARAREVAQTRESELVDGDLRWDATSAERFRMQRPGPATGTSDLHWEAPPGWVELATTSMRQANFQVAGDERAECYLTILPGDGGGLVANVNRWRKQMSLPALDTAEIEALPRAEFFGAEATAVDFEGTWTGMSGDQAGESYRLVGLLQVDRGAARFLKMTGPKSLVDGQQAAFRALASSFHQGHGEHAGAPPGATDSGASDAHVSDLQASDLQASHLQASQSGGGFSWTTPDGWIRTPDRPMRAVTFRVGDDEPAECYVALLGGSAGGLVANVNRWRQQMGAEPISEAEVADLPSVSMLGAAGVIVECRGAFEGMAGETYADALLYGTVCSLGDRTVFVKFVGPERVVAPQREAFLRFCESLQPNG